MRANANFIPGIERVPACEIRRIIFILRNLTHSDLWNPVIYPTESSKFRSYEIEYFILRNLTHSGPMKSSYFILRNLAHSGPMKAN